jgi:hypothetical protein
MYFPVSSRTRLSSDAVCLTTSRLPVQRFLQKKLRYRAIHRAALSLGPYARSPDPGQRYQKRQSAFGCDQPESHVLNNNRWYEIRDKFQKLTDTLACSQHLMNPHSGRHNASVRHCWPVDTGHLLCTSWFPHPTAVANYMYMTLSSISTEYHSRIT